MAHLNDYIVAVALVVRGLVARGAAHLQKIIVGLYNERTSVAVDGEAKLSCHAGALLTMLVVCIVMVCIVIVVVVVVSHSVVTQKRDTYEKWQKRSVHFGHDFWAASETAGRA